jgi:FKBP-type peptidyl-prolyl cis-trans isomerase FkpA
VSAAREGAFVSNRIASLLVFALCAAALGCGQDDAAPGTAQEESAPAAGASAAAPSPEASAPAGPGAPEGSPYSVTHEREGTGASPTATDFVTVHYAGRLANGSVFDSSYDRGQPATFPLNGVISCWTQGVAQMKVGGKATLVCPPDMAYGPSGQGPIPPNATLTFEVELLDVKPPPQ